MKIPLGLLIAYFLLLSVPAGAEPIYELVRKIENPKGPVDGKGDKFGNSLDRVGENLLVGANLDNTGANDAGAAYLFDPRGNLITAFYNPTPEEGEWFGWTARGFGEKVIISASREGSQAEKSGAIYIYESDGTLLQTILNPTPDAGDAFGQRILGFGDKILVTSMRDSSRGKSSGVTYLFDQNGELLQTFLKPNAVAGDFLGRNIAAIDDQKFIVGAYGEDIDGWRGAGAAYVFDLDGSPPLRIPNPDPTKLDGFGNGLALVGTDKILIGASQADTADGISSGKAYLYDLDGNLLRTIENPTPEQLDWFGRDVMGITDDTFIVGAIFDDTMHNNSGAAYLFNIYGELLQTFLPPVTALNGHFGSDFAVIGDSLFISNHFDGGRFTGAGAVYEYRLVPEPSTWFMLAIGATMLVIARRQKACRDGGKQ